MSNRRNTTILASVFDLLWKISKRYPVDAAVVGGSLVALLALGRWAGWTLGFALLLWLFALPVKALVAREVWLYRYRIRRAGASLRWPGRKEALAFRKTISRRMADLRKQWEAVMQSNGLINGAKIAPALRRLDWKIDGTITAEIHPGKLATKGGLRAIMAKREEIAEICGADGGLRVRPFGKVADSIAPGSARLAFFYEKQVWPTLPIQALPAADLEHIALGNDEDLRPATITLYSTLLVAMTGKGKSQAIWTILVSFALAMRHRLYVVDPKGGQEMGALRSLLTRGWVGNRKVESYGADSGAAAYRTIMAAEAAMMAQQVALEARGIRKWQPSHAEEFPAIILVIDEMITLLNRINATNKPGKEALLALENMLTQGRAAGCWLMMATQASDKEILGHLRTFIPNRIVLGTENAMQTNMAFGDSQAEVNGALCSQIDEPGIGYLKVDGLRDYRKIRIAYVEDADIEAFVEKGLPDNMGQAETSLSERWRPGFVYYYWTPENLVIDGRYYPPRQLLYVGETTTPPARHIQHVADFNRGDAKHYWMKWADLSAPSLVVTCDSKEQAVEIQNQEIRDYGPFGNIVMNQDTPWQGFEPTSIPVGEVHPSFAERWHLGGGKPRQVALRRQAKGRRSQAAQQPAEPGLDILRPELEPEVVPVREPVAATRIWPPAPAARVNGHEKAGVR